MDTACIDGAQTVLSYFTFAGGDPDDYWANQCTNDLDVHSLWAAAKLYCTPDEIEAGSKLLAGYCSEYGSVELVPYSKILPDLTDDYIASLPVVEFSDVNATKVWNHSVLMSKDLYIIGMKTTTTFDRESRLHHAHGWALYGFWGGLLLIGLTNRLLSHLFTSRRIKSSGDVEGANPPSPPSLGPLASLHHWFRANLIIPAAFGTHHQRLFWWCSVPTRMETIVVVAYYILNLVLFGVSYYIFYPNLYYTKAMQAWRYVADRTGIMAYSNLPIIWMFSGRNNIFLWLTGWSFSTFNIFHRHVARIVTVQAIVHSVSYTAIEANYGELAESWTEQYWYMGAIATFSMGLLLVLSSIWMRKHSYEAFLLLHISMSVLVIVGLFYHTRIFDGEFDPYLWPVVAIWLFDRVARFTRLAYCNLHVRFSSAPVTSKTTATYAKDADLIRLEIVPGSQLLKPGPGQHYFVYQPMKWKGWENHPFTLGAWVAAGQESPIENATGDRTTAEKHLDKEIQVVPAGSSTDDSSSGPSVGHEPELVQQGGSPKLVFFVRPFSSWTMRLRDECLKSPTGSITPRVLIEGPYGERSPLNAYENVIFIVGGTGVSGALPYLQDHVSRVAARTTRTRQITFVWTTKQAAMIEELTAQELKPFLGREDIRFSFHATVASAKRIEDDSEKSSGPRCASPITISHERPNVRDTVINTVNEVHEAGAVGGRIAILTCGPAGMADEARAAVHHTLKTGKRGVEYIEETFGW